MKFFLVDCFRGKKRATVHEHLFESMSNIQKKRVARACILGVLSAIGLVLFGSVMVYFILTFSVSIGPRSTALFLMFVFLSTVHGFWLVQVRIVA
jgi:hypothetical protein